MHLRIILFTSFFCLTLQEVPGLTQSVAVKGQLMCGDEFARNIRVKLFDEDTGPDPDDLLDQGYSDNNGNFMLHGSTEEGTPIDPTLKIYHNCNDELEPGYRKLTFTLPDKAISRAAKPNATFNAGVIQLELEFEDEEREYTVD